MRQDQQLTTLSALGKEYYISLEIFVTHHSELAEWKSVFSLETNSICPKSPTPAIFLSPENKLTITSAMNRDCDYAVTLDTVNEGVWIQIVIQQIIIDDKVIEKILIWMILFPFLF